MQRDLISRRKHDGKWQLTNNSAIPLVFFSLYEEFSLLQAHMATQLQLTIEFGGGAELLFDKKKKHIVSLPGEQQWTLNRLILWMRDNMLTERPELFIQDDTVRPGILVLVNEADWELLGQGEYVLQPNDTVLFISTLHGG